MPGHLKECLLHVSYRLPIKKWQVRCNDKPVVQARKSEIQMQLRGDMGLLVDIPIANSGNTNNVNTARRVFQRTRIGINNYQSQKRAFICKFSVILRVLASGHQIDSETFCSYAMETAEIFVELYH